MYTYIHACVYASICMYISMQIGMHGRVNVRVFTCKLHTHAYLLINEQLSLIPVTKTSLASFCM